jgi:hypothetical protein
VAEVPPLSVGLIVSLHGPVTAMHKRLRVGSSMLRAEHEDDGIYVGRERSIFNARVLYVGRNISRGYRHEVAVQFPLEDGARLAAWLHGSSMGSLALWRGGRMIARAYRVEGGVAAVVWRNSSEEVDALVRDLMDGDLGLDRAGG